MMAPGTDARNATHLPALGMGAWLMLRGWSPTTDYSRGHSEMQPGRKLGFWREVNIFSKQALSQASF